MASALSAIIFIPAMLAAALSFGAGRFLLRQDFLADIPNHRSAHKRTVPRSGGVSIFIGWAAAMAAAAAAFFYAAHLPAPWLLFAAFSAGAFMTGLVDDWRALPALLKLVAEIALAAGFVILSHLSGAVPGPQSISIAISVFWIVAFMNAFNFMDGVNGIASTAALFVLGAIAVAAAGAGLVLWAAPALFLSFALLGFLPLNLPSARLFMGDGGSLFVGFVIAALALLLSAEGGGAVSPLFVPTAFAPFLYDVAFTLVHRAARGRNILAAHHEHLYQLLARAGRKHVSVTAIYLTLTALSTAAAILANSAGGIAPYVAPFILFALFTPLALRVFAAGKKAGLLSSDKMRVEPTSAGNPRAAE